MTVVHTYMNVCSGCMILESCYSLHNVLVLLPKVIVNHQKIIAARFNMQSFNKIIDFGFTKANITGHTNNIN